MCSARCSRGLATLERSWPIPISRNISRAIDALVTVHRGTSLIYPSTVEIHKGEQSKSNTGAVTRAYVLAYENVPADMQGRKGSVRRKAAGKRHAADYIAMMGPTTDIAVRDWVIFDGRTYMATFIADFDHHLEVYLSMVN